VDDTELRRNRPQLRDHVVFGRGAVAAKARVKILGASAGGGFPQWNCGCPNCRGVREGTARSVARTQSQVALGVAGRWLLLNASPDLRSQIEATPELHPGGGVRHTPIEAVVLTNADLDHVLGLLLLREFEPLRLYSTPAVRSILTEDNSMFGMLRQFPEQLAWCDVIPGRTFEPWARDGLALGLRCTPLAVRGSYPAYVPAERRARLPPDQAVLGLLLETAEGGTLGYFPGLPDVDEAWLERVERCDVLLVDGTFWTDDELPRVRGGGRSAREMGHLPLSGPEGSLARLSRLAHPRKVFVHVNNTNPMLDEDGPEFRQVREAGWEVARDGMELSL